MYANGSGTKLTDPIKTCRMLLTACVLVGAIGAVRLIVTEENRFDAIIVAACQLALGAQRLVGN